MLNPFLLFLAFLGSAIGVIMHIIDYPFIENVLVTFLFFCCIGYLMLFLLQLKPARGIMRRGQLAEQARIETQIDNIRKQPFITSVQFDPRKGIISGKLGIRKTWRRYAVDVVLWLANHHLLPWRLTIWAAELLGWKYKGETQE